MNGYFIALLVIDSIALGIHLVKHGETEIRKYNFWTALISCVIEMILIIQAIRTGF